MIKRKKYTVKLSITEEMPKIKLSFIGASPKLEKKILGFGYIITKTNGMKNV